MVSVKMSDLFYLVLCDMLRLPYIQKNLRLFHVIVCHFLVNDIEVRKTGSKKYRNVAQRDKKSHFVSDVLFE